MMIFDFKVKEDEFGYYVIGYRMLGTSQMQYTTNHLLATVFCLSEDDYQYYIYNEYGSEEKPKNGKMHFTSYEQAIQCVDGLRKLLHKAIETNHFFLA